MLKCALSLLLASGLSFSALSAQPNFVLIISYAECDANFNVTTQGKERANALPYYFSQTISSTYATPSAIFGARQTAETSGGNCVLATATPTSKLLGTPLHLGFSQDNPGALVDFIFNNSAYDNQTILIVWDFAAIPSLIEAFGYIAPELPHPAAYDLTYVLQFPYAFLFIPTVLGQMLIYGDSS